MTNIITVLFSIFLSALNPSEEIKEVIVQDSITTYYLIRHAEKDRSNKDKEDPELNEEGKARAQKWAKVLRDVKFNAVYSTNYKRTLQTAEPLAEQNNLKITSYDANELFNDEFEKATTGKKVLVVGHSNTTPAFVNKIIKQNKYASLDDSENGALFIVQILPDGSKLSQVLYMN